MFNFTYFRLHNSILYISKYMKIISRTRCKLLYFLMNPAVLNNDQDSPKKITKITESFYIFQIQSSQNHILGTNIKFLSITFIY